MKHLDRLTVTATFVALAVCLALVAPASAQAIYLEAEVSGGANDTFALAEDCTQIGSHFLIKGTVHAGNSNSDDEWFMFNGAAGACVDIDFNITQAVATGSLYQLNVWLYDSSQTMVAAWNTSTVASSANFGIGPYILPATDTYYIYVTEWSVAPNALAQPGLVFTPLSVHGYSVTGATPDSTRNTAGGNQTIGSLYEITVNVSSGNEAQFDVFIDRDPTGAFVCSPDAAPVCWVPGGTTNARFRASAKCPPGGLNVTVMGGGSGLVLPGSTLLLNAPGPGVAAPYTVDDGTGPQLGGELHIVRALVMRNGQPVKSVQICPGPTACLDVCAPPGSTYIAALSLSSLAPITIAPFLPGLELDITDVLFAGTFPVNQYPTFLGGSQGLPGFNQICFTLPPGLVSAPGSIYLQVVTHSGAILTGLTPTVRLELMP